MTERRLTAGTPVTIEGQGGPIVALPFRQEHGDIASLGFRFGNFAYSARSQRPAAGKRCRLGGPRCLDCRCAALPAASEPFLAGRRAGWIERLKPRRAILTNLHADLDYEVLRGKLPVHVVPAFDGMTFAVVR